MRSVLSLAPVSLTLFLVACGGGNSSGGSVVTPSAPSPTPSSGPTPTPGAGPNLLTMTANQQLSQLDSVLLYERADSGGVAQFSTFPPEASQTFSYEASTRSWGFYFAASNIPPYNIYPNFVVERFGASELVAARSSAVFNAYQKTDAGAVYSLALLKPGPVNSQLNLSYVGIGEAEGTKPDAGGGSTTTDYRAFSFGYYAEASALPASGTGTYTGIVIGRAASASSSRVYKLSGTIILTASFSDSKFSGNVTLTGVDDRTGSSSSFGTFPIVMNTGPQPLNYITGYVGPGADVFRAYLAGPTADELAGTFTLTLPDPQTSGVNLTAVAAVGARR